jgi:GNAT superfamily N-acetyltransferase
MNKESAGVVCRLPAEPDLDRQAIRRLCDLINRVGCVNVKLMQAGIAEFGMLVADPAHRSKGIGSALIAAAEDWARKMKCGLMRLELLTPRTWNHPSKEFLKAWYTRDGPAAYAR